jgi:GT2 family glycosyltransferase
MFTIVFLSLHSEIHIRRLVSSIDTKFPIIIIENSQNYELKKELEEKYKNIRILIPKKNIGFSAGFNLGIRESKTDMVFLNSADVAFSKECLNQLEECVKNINDFTIIGPTYEDNEIHKNYGFWDKSKLNKVSDKGIKGKYKVKEVDYIDNDFIINKKQISDLGYFDENFFIYFETTDFCKRVRFANKKIYVCDKIKFSHFHSQSHDPKYSHQAALSRNWHYNWSKFYYFKKHINYFFALKKVAPNFFRAIKNMILSKMSKKEKKYSLHKAEFLGILYSILNKPASYRPYEKQ